MAEEMNLWGYVSQDEMGGSNNFGNWKWGVNFDVRLKNIEYHKAGTNDNGQEIGAKVVLTFAEKDNDNETATQKLNIYEPDEEKQKDFNGNELVKGSEEFEKAYKRQTKTSSRALCEIAECFVDGRRLNEGILKAQERLLSEKKKFGFAEFANVIINAIKSDSKWQDRPLDLFLQYASKLSSKGNSYLVVPNANMGHFVVPHQVGEWEEEKVPFSHYRLYLKENGVKTQKLHPIMRGNFESFWKNNAEKVTMENKKEDVFAETSLTAESISTPSSSSNDIDWDNL